MGPVSPERYTDLADYFQAGWVDIIQGLAPAEQDGDLENVKSMLRDVK